MKVVIFCGGQGMRLEVGAFSERLPKPMASIGGRPLLWHIMRYYAHFGHTEFVLCLGYRGGVIADYFRRDEFPDAAGRSTWSTPGSTRASASVSPARASTSSGARSSSAPTATR